MNLDPNILADLGVAITPRCYVRVTLMAHASTPLGAGFGVTRFASPTRAFKVTIAPAGLRDGSTPEVCERAKAGCAGREATALRPSDPTLCSKRAETARRAVRRKAAWC